jgi:hypothetical protein
LPTRFDKERANARSALGSGELVRPSQQDPDSDKASPKAFSKGSSMSQPAHNQNHEAAHNTNGVPNPRYANLSDNCQSMRSRNAAERGSRHFRGRIRSMLTSVILVSMPKKPRTTSKQSLPLS